MEAPKARNKKKAEKPTYHDFLNRLQVTIAPFVGKKDPTRAAFRQLSKGYQGTIENEHIEELCRFIFLWNHFPNLALRVAIEISTKRKSSVFMERLFKKIKNEMAERTQFPRNTIPLFTNVKDTERSRILQKWIQSNEKEGTLDLVWTKNAAVCLLDEHMTDEDIQVIQYLLERFFRKMPKKAVRRSEEGRGDKHGTYVKLVIPLFIAGKSAKKKASFALEMSQMFLDKAKLYENENRDLRDSQLLIKGELNSVRSSLNEKENDLKQLSVQKVELEKVVESKDQALAEEKERYQLLEQHWQQKCKHELERQSYNFKKYFAFEINEAILSLDTARPDIGMALNRIKHMEEYLHKMEHVDE